jgi:hypothetical protein
MRKNTKNQHPARTHVVDAQSITAEPAKRQASGSWLFFLHNMKAPFASLQSLPMKLDDARSVAISWLIDPTSLPSNTIEVDSLYLGPCLRA